MSISVVAAPNQGPQLAQFTVDLSKAAATYDICTAGGDLMLHDVCIYCSVVGATFTSVSIQTNDTTAYSILTSTEGGVANITAGKDVPHVILGTTPYSRFLASGKKIQYTMAGSTGTGTLTMAVRYTPVVPGKTLA